MPAAPVSLPERSTTPPRGDAKSERSLPRREGVGIPACSSAGARRSAPHPSLPSKPSSRTPLARRRAAGASPHEERFSH